MATARRLPSREMVELTPEATPAASGGTEERAVAVIGATSPQSPVEEKREAQHSEAPQVPLRFHEHEEERSRADEHRPEDEVEARAVAICEPAEARGQQDRHHADRRESQACLERREAEKLQVERQVDEDTPDRGIDEKRLGVCGREVPPAKEAER